VKETVAVVTSMWIAGDRLSDPYSRQQEIVLVVTNGVQTVKTLTKITVAAVLAIAASAPAFASEGQGQEERNAYLYTADARPIVAHVQLAHADIARGTDAQASVPLPQPAYDPAANVADY
jgi:hypothetical protein